MATIKHLSNEILHAIFSLLTSKDLLATSLVSHLFHANSACSLSKEASFDISDYPPSTRELLQLFLRTLLVASGNETLASHVRSVVVDIASTVPKTYPRPTPGPHPDIELLSAAAIRLGFNEHPLTSRGTQLVLLLRLLSNLTFLTLRSPAGAFGSSKTEFNATLDSLITLPSGLHSLREFKFDSANGPYMETRLLAALMALPSIRKITVAFVIGDYTATAAGTSRVTELTILSSHLSTESLAEILTLPEALTRFTYAVAGRFWFFPLALFGRALLPLEDSVEYLNIDLSNLDLNEYSTQVDVIPMDVPPVDTIGSLRGWYNLRILEIPLLALLGRSVAGGLCLSDLVPVRLKEIVVHDDAYSSVKQMVRQVIGLLEDL